MQDMNEADWLEGDPLEMLDFLDGQVSDRQQRLIACAFVRLVWDWLEDDRSRKAVEVAELYADGRATDEELAAARKDTEAVLKEREEEVEAENRWIEEEFPGCENEYLDLDNDDGNRAATAAATTVAATVDAGCCEYPIFYMDLNIDRMSAEANILWDILGNPWRPLPEREFPASIRRLAQECYDGNHDLFDLLADYLEDAGEVEAAAHCRQDEHVKGCHVLDWVLGRYEPVSLRKIRQLHEREHRERLDKWLSEAQVGATVTEGECANAELRQLLTEARGCEMVRLLRRFVVVPSDPRILGLVAAINDSTYQSRGPIATDCW
jgi:hypothetical protein